MEQLKQLVVAFIAKTQGKTPEEVSSLLFKKNEAGDAEVINDDALNALFELDKSRVKAQTQKFETEKKELYDKGYNKAKAESLSNFESDLREKYQITEEKRGLELVEAILAAKAAKPGEVDDEQVKRSKIFIDTINQLKAEKEKGIKEWKDKFDGREKELRREATFRTVSENALKELKALNPILPEDETIAKEWEKIFLDRIKQYEFEPKEDGKTIVVLEKDGDAVKAYVDEHGHPISFTDTIKKTASSLFKFKTEEPRRGTGNNNDDGGSGAGKKGYTGPKPKDEAEYQKMISEAKDEETQIAITKVWTGA